MNSIKLNGNKITPSKVVCIGRNYVEHIEELNNEVPSEPVIFIKPNSAISNEIYSGKTDTIHYEGEISFLVVSSKISAIGMGLDLTKREVQTKLKTKGLPWERAKSFDNSAVFSDFVPFNGNMKDLRMELYINSVLIQKAEYQMMLNKPNDILNEIKTFLTLEDGDIVMTGTPKGVGEIKTGDIFLGKIFEGDQLLVDGSWVVK
ncbi:MAG: fumarylacetoacetate hydrolase family protein [Desulfobacterales bacterium]|nr:fumarylacetoacetate hydrolase family protein [Desulfobacterales bacterium]MCP4161678.1 fumarylacetoacetate hydrolase family protein [Deltaproteobacteria bacterium]